MDEERNMHFLAERLERAGSSACHTRGSKILLWPRREETGTFTVFLPIHVRRRDGARGKIHYHVRACRQPATRVRQRNRIPITTFRDPCVYRRSVLQSATACLRLGKLKVSESVMTIDQVHSPIHSQSTPVASRTQ